MTTLTVGRISFSVESGLDIEQSGDEMSVSGETIFANFTEAAAFAVQLNGYADSPDEEVVPVIYEEMPDLTGFYRVRELRVERPVDTSFEGLFPFRLTLERVRQAAAPLQQITHQGKSRVTAGSWNLAPNPSGESGTSGVGIYQGTSGIAAVTNPAPSGGASFGLKTIRATWSQATTAAGGGLYQEAPAKPGLRYSVGINFVKSSINNRLAIRLRFLHSNGTELAGMSAPAVQVSAGPSYTASDFKVESQVAPAGTAKVQVQITSVSGTGFANWSIGSYLETDAWVICVAPIMLGQGLAAWDAASRLPYVSLMVPASANSLVAKERRTEVVSAPVLTPETLEVGSVLGFRLAYNEFSASFSCPPEEHYEGAVTLRAGTTLDTVVGRQLVNTPDAWLLGNGKFEVRPVYDMVAGDPDGSLGLEYRRFVSGDWGSWQRALFGRTLTYPVTYEPKVIAVLRNTPEAVTIRLMAAAYNLPLPGTYLPTTYDITLRRGDGYVSIECTAPIETSFSVRFDAAYGGTSFASAVAGPYHFWDSSTGRFVASPTPIITGSTLDTMYVSDTKRWSVGLGFCVDYLSVASPEPRFEQFEYLWGGSESQNVSLL